MREVSTIYQQLGRCLETAQQMEFFATTALLAADGLRSGVHVHVRDGEYRRLVEKLDRLTLGSALKSLRDRIEVPSDAERTLEIALQARNRLVHELLAKRGLAHMDEAAITELTADLQNIELDLKAGYGVASSIAKALINESLNRRVSAMLTPGPRPEGAA